jgi:glutaminase
MTQSADRHELQRLVDHLHEEYRSLTDGQVATYIPELAKASAHDFAICIVTEDGRTFEAGDCDRSFTMQSVSKPFTFGMALEAFGHDAVARYVGVEPSGEAFNSISLQDDTNRPFNPMINTGAITVTALLHARYGERALDHLLATFGAAAGRSLTVDEAVYQSENRTGHRNRAIAHLLLNFGVVHEEAEAALDLYFRQCAILVTCR